MELSRTRDLDEFRSHYFEAGRAVVLEGGARAMPAFHLWSSRYLADKLKSCTPTVRLTDGRLARMGMESFFEYFDAPERYASTTGPVYLTDFYLTPGFGEDVRELLARDAACPFDRHEARAEWISLYAGPGGTSSPLHQDVFGTHTWLAQIRGTKVWRLVAPEDLDDQTAVGCDAFGERELSFAVYEAVLAPGDLIYLPPNWWHQVKNLTETIAISGNFCTFEHARRALAEVEARAASPMKEVWRKTWHAILEKAPAPLMRSAS